MSDKELRLTIPEIRAIGKFTRLATALLPIFSDPKKLKTIVEGFDEIKATADKADQASRDLAAITAESAKNTETLEKISAKKDRLAEVKSLEDDLAQREENLKDGQKQLMLDQKELADGQAKLADDNAKLADELQEVADLKKELKQKIKEAEDEKKEFKAAAVAEINKI